MITQATIWGSLKDRALQNIFSVSDTGAPTNGTTGTGAGVLGPGSNYIDYATGNCYYNVGTLASPVWVLAAGATTPQQLNGTITAANIIATTAGAFGHANGVIMVPAPGVGFGIAVISCVMVTTFSVAAYTLGGNITVNNGAGGAAITGLVSAANSLGNAATKVNLFVPLSTAGFFIVDNGPINLVSSAAFTNPGTAVGVVKWRITFMTVPTV